MKMKEILILNYFQIINSHIKKNLVIINSHVSKVRYLIKHNFQYIAYVCVSLVLLKLI